MAILTWRHRFDVPFAPQVRIKFSSQHYIGGCNDDDPKRTGERCAALNRGWVERGQSIFPGHWLCGRCFRLSVEGVIEGGLAGSVDCVGLALMVMPLKTAAGISSF
jgi:hypothetical protein